MAEIAKDDINLSGYTISLTSASAEDTFKNNFQDLVLILENTDSTSHDAKIVAQETCNLGHLHDQVVSVGASSTVIVSNIDESIFNDDNGLTHITYGGNEAMFKVGVARVHSD